MRTCIECNGSQAGADERAGSDLRESIGENPVIVAHSHVFEFRTTVESAARNEFKIGTCIVLHQIDTALECCAIDLFLVISEIGSYERDTFKECLVVDCSCGITIPGGKFGRT